MNLILDASALLHPLTGIGRYTNELARGLLNTSSNFDLKFWAQNKLLHDLDEVNRLQPRTHFPLWSKPFRVMRNRYSAFRNEDAFSKSLFHGPNFFLPEAAQNGVVTVHDLSVFLYPETHPAERLRQFDLNFERSIRQAKKIITDSEYVRQELISRFSCPEAQVVTVHIGVSSEYVPLDIINYELLARYQLVAQNYTLCVATIEPRKNIDKLLQAYSLLPSNLRQRYPLVLVGGYGWLAEKIIKQIEKGISEGWVRKLGYVSEQDLIGLYQHARVFAYPSAYEGFGLPVLEAMACGVPVVTSDRSSLPEVAGGAAALVNPDDVKSLICVLEKALIDAQWRHTASVEGRIIASGFSWDMCVKKTMDVYKAVSLTM